MELWNEARGIPRYDISSWGQVFDKQKFRLLKQTPDRAGNMIHAFELGLAEPCYAVTRVRIRETGQIFPSTGAADRYLGVSPGGVSKTLRGLQPTCKGYTFDRIGGEAHDS